MSERTATANLVRVYVWEWPVRVTHWLIAGSIMLCAATGIYIGSPFVIASGPAGDRFVMGWAKILHSYGAIVFTLSVLSRIVWMFLGNTYAQWNKFIPVTTKRWRGILPSLNFYVFRMRKPPGYVWHNPVAGMTYSLVFVLFLVEIATGFAQYAAHAAVGSPMRMFGFLVALTGGLQTARWIHHVVMWLLLGFMVHHVYSAVLMSQVEGNGTLESIFSGYKFVPPEDLTYSGYRFIDRNDVHA
jgi:Ni/Fe-hydrogenase 1 B-type cytochrome subunit